MRVYTYVDGESHFIRSASLWRDIHGETAQLVDIESRSPGTSGSAFPNSHPPFVLVDPATKFFWDVRYLTLAPQPFHDRQIDGAVYFTAFSGDDQGYHQACVRIRQHRFEPRVTHERALLADRRSSILKANGIVEKAKGVDVGLSVRVLEDAYHNIFDVCLLFTSDVDFLPVVRVVQRLGKKVVVFGYLTGLGSRSELEYVPDAFVDLSRHMRATYLMKRAG